MNKISLIKKVLIMSLLTFGASLCVYMSSDVVKQDYSLKVGVVQDQVDLVEAQPFEDSEEDWVLTIKGNSAVEDNSSALFAQSNNEVELNQINVRATGYDEEAGADDRGPYWYTPGLSFKFPRYSNNKAGYALLGFVVVEVGGVKVTVPETYAKNGTETFEGVTFNTNGDGYLTGINASTAITKDIKLKAVWKAIEFTITYNSNGGTFISTEANPSISGTTQKYKTTDDIKLASATRDRYTFKGWKVTSVTGPASWTYTVGRDTYSGYSWGSNNVFGAENITNLNVGSGKYNNITLTAQWEAVKYTITYNPDGGQLNSSSANPSMSGTTQKYTVEDNITLASATRDHYQFKGWKANTSVGTWIKDTLYKDNIGSGKYGDITLTAEWQIIHYTIKYVLNDGTFDSFEAEPTVTIKGTVRTQKYTVEDNITLASATKDGYRFDGWKPEATTGNWDKDAPYKGNVGLGKYGDVTLTAQWWQPTITYEYTEHGKGGVIKNQKYEYKVEETIDVQISPLFPSYMNTSIQPNKYVAFKKWQLWRNDTQYVEKYSGGYAYFYETELDKSRDDFAFKFECELEELPGESEKRVTLTSLVYGWSDFKLEAEYFSPKSMYKGELFIQIDLYSSPAIESLLQFTTIDNQKGSSDYNKLTQAFDGWTAKYNTKGELIGFYKTITDIDVTSNESDYMNRALSAYLPSGLFDDTYDGYNWEFVLLEYISTDNEGFLLPNKEYVCNRIVGETDEGVWKYACQTIYLAKIDKPCAELYPNGGILSESVYDSSGNELSQDTTHNKGYKYFTLKNEDSYGEYSMVLPSVEKEGCEFIYWQEVWYYDDNHKGDTVYAGDKRTLSNRELYDMAYCVLRFVASWASSITYVCEGLSMDMYGVNIENVGYETYIQYYIPGVQVDLPTSDVVNISGGIFRGWKVKSIGGVTGLSDLTDYDNGIITYTYGGSSTVIGEFYSEGRAPDVLTYLTANLCNNQPIVLTASYEPIEYTLTLNTNIEYGGFYNIDDTEWDETIDERGYTQISKKYTWLSNASYDIDLMTDKLTGVIAKFAGWFEDKACTIRAYVDYFVVTEDKPLYAGWYENVTIIVKTAVDNADERNFNFDDVDTNGSLPAFTSSEDLNGNGYSEIINLVPVYEAETICDTTDILMEKLNTKYPNYDITLYTDEKCSAELERSTLLTKDNNKIYAKYTIKQKTLTLKAGPVSNGTTIKDNAKFVGALRFDSINKWEGDATSIYVYLPIGTDLSALTYEESERITNGDADRKNAIEFSDAGFVMAYYEDGAMEPSLYRFIGWFDDENGNSILDAGETLYTDYEMPNNELTLTAHWEKEYSITYKTEDETTITAEENWPIGYIKGEEIVLPIWEPNINDGIGKRLKEWKDYDNNKTYTYNYDNKEFSSNLDTSLLKDVTLTAILEEIEYTITYDMTGAEGTINANNANPDITESGTKYEQKYTIRDIITLATATYQGDDDKEFKCWKVTCNECLSNVCIHWGDEDGNIYLTDGNSFTGKYGNITLTPNFGYRQYTITYDTAGGELDDGEYTKNSYTYETEITLPSVSRTGYKFDSWRETGGTAKWNPLGKYIGYIGSGYKGDVTLIAIWEPITYNITYMDDVNNDNIGDNVINYAPNQYTIESSIVLPRLSNKFGWDFIGWKPSGENHNWGTDELSFENILTEMYGDVTLTACYEESKTDNGPIIDWGDPDDPLKNNQNNTVSLMSVSTRSSGSFDEFILNLKTGQGSEILEESTDLGTLQYKDESKIVDVTYKKLKAPTIPDGEEYDKYRYSTFKGFTISGELEGVVTELTIKETGATKKGRIYTDNYTYKYIFVLSDDGDYLEYVVTAENYYFGSIRLTPKYVYNIYQVTFNFNEATSIDDNGIGFIHLEGDDENVYSYTYNTTIKLPTITKEGWTFIGWTIEYGTNVNGEEHAKWPADKSTNIMEIDNANEYAGNVTLTAIFSQDEFSIVLNVGEGQFKNELPTGWSVNDNNCNIATYKYKVSEWSDTEITLLNSDYVLREHYTFKGWDISDTPTHKDEVGNIHTFRFGEGDDAYSYCLSYDEDNLYKAVLKDSKGTITLTAVWEINQYEITLNSTQGIFDSNKIDSWNLLDDNKQAKKYFDALTDYSSALLDSESLTYDETIEFAGWWTKNGTGNNDWGSEIKDGKIITYDEDGSILSQIDVSLEKKTDLFARWIQKYKVTLNINPSNLSGGGTINSENALGWVLVDAEGRPVVVSSASSYAMQLFAEGDRYDEKLPTTADLIPPTGYEFDGWWTKNGTGDNDWESQIVGEQTMGDRDITIYAKWQPIKITIKLDPQGGTFDNYEDLKTKEEWTDEENGVLSKQIDYNSEFVFVGVTKEHNDFICWNTSSGSTTGGYTSTTSIKNFKPTDADGKLIKETTYYAVWQAIDYTLTLTNVNESEAFNALQTAGFARNDATGDYQLAYQFTQTINLPAINLTGKSVKAWKVVSNSSGSWVKDTEIQLSTDSSGNYYGHTFEPEQWGNVTLEAVWSFKEYTLTLDVNGVDLNGKTPVNSNSITITNWNGWSGNLPTLSKLVESEALIITSDYLEVDPDSDMSYVHLPSVLARDGYIFKYWGIKGNDGSVVKLTVNSTMPCSSLTLYAVWEINSYNLNLYPNGGTFSNVDGWGSSAIEDAEGNRIIILITSAEYNAIIGNKVNVITSDYISRTGYNLIGWYTKDGTGDDWGTGIYYKNGENWETNESYSMPAEDLNLYARWEEIPYTITLDLNGYIPNETNIMPDGKTWTLGIYGYTTEYYIGEEFSIPSIARSGYTYYNDITGSKGTISYENSTKWVEATDGDRNQKFIELKETDKKFKYSYKILTVESVEYRQYTYFNVMKDDKDKIIGGMGNITIEFTWVPIEYTITYKNGAGIPINPDGLTYSKPGITSEFKAITAYTIESSIWLPTDYNMVTIKSWHLKDVEDENTSWGEDYNAPIETGSNINEGKLYGNVTLQILQLSTRTVYIDPNDGYEDNDTNNIITEHMITEDASGNTKWSGLYSVSVHENIIKYNAENIRQYIYKNGYGQPVSFYGWVLLAPDADISTYSKEILYKYKGEAIDLPSLHINANMVKVESYTDDEINELLAEGKLYVWEVVTNVDKDTVLAFNTIYATYGSPIEYSVEYYVNEALVASDKIKNNPTEFNILGLPSTDADGNPCYISYNLGAVDSSVYPNGYTHKTTIAGDATTYYYSVMNFSDYYNSGKQIVDKDGEIEFIGKGNYLSKGITILKLKVVLVPIEYSITYQIPAKNEDPRSSSSWEDKTVNDKYTIETEGYSLINNSNKSTLFGDRDRDDQNAINLVGWQVDLSGKTLTNSNYSFVEQGSITEDGKLLYYGTLTLTTDTFECVLQVNRFKYSASGGFESYVATRILQGSYGDIKLKGVFEVNQYTITYIVKGNDATGSEIDKTIKSIDINGETKTVNSTSYQITYTYYEILKLADKFIIGETDYLASSWTVAYPETDGEISSNWNNGESLNVKTEDGASLAEYTNKYGNIILQYNIDESWENTLTILIKPGMTINKDNNNYSGEDPVDLTEEEITSLGLTGVWKKITVKMTANGSYITPRRIINTNGYENVMWNDLTGAIDTASQKVVAKDSKGYYQVKCNVDAVLIVNGDLKGYQINFYQLNSVVWKDGFTADEITQLTDDDYNVTFTIESGFTLPQTPKPGYDFKGWRLLNTNGNIGAGDLSGTYGSGWYLDSSPLNLYAVYEALNYKVTYLIPTDSSGEEIDNTSTDEYYIISGLELLTNIDKTGYEFKGWIVKEATFEEFDEATNIVKYRADGSYFELLATNESGKYLCNKIWAGSYGDITLQAVITPITYNINMDADEDATTSDEGDIKGNKNWTLKTTNSYDETSLEALSRYAQGTYNIETESYVLPTSDEVGMRGHTFLGWMFNTTIAETNKTEDGGASYIEAIIKDGSGNITACFKAKIITVEGNDYVTEILKDSYGNIQLLAKWKINKYNLKFDANGGYVSLPNDNYELVEPITTINSKEYSEQALINVEYHKEYLEYLIDEEYMLRYGYTFRGWYTDDGTDGNWGTHLNIQPLSAYLMPAKDETIYAKWEVIEYEISFVYVNSETDINNSSKYQNLDIEEITYTIEQTVTLPSVNGGTDGWYFGYYLNNSGDEIATLEANGNWYESGTTYAYSEMVTGKYGNVVLCTVIPNSKITLLNATITDSNYYNGELPKFNSDNNTIEYNSQYEVILPISTQTQSVPGSSFTGWIIQGVNKSQLTITGTQATYNTFTFEITVDEDDYLITKIVKGSYGDITLDAVWDVHGYTIRLIDSDDASKFKDIPASYSEKQTLDYTTIDAFENKDKQFIGWVFESAYQNDTANLTTNYVYSDLYAKLNSSESVTELPTDVSGAVIFKNGLKVSELTGSNEVINIYAIWRPIYKVEIKVDKENTDIYVNGVKRDSLEEEYNKINNTFNNGFVLPTRLESDSLFETPNGGGVQLYRKGYYIVKWKIQVGSNIYYVKNDASSTVLPVPSDWMVDATNTEYVNSGVNLQYLQGNITATPIWQGMSFTVIVTPGSFADVGGVKNPDNISSVNGYKIVDTYMHYGDNYVIYNGASLDGYTTINSASLVGYTLTSAEGINSTTIELSGCWNYENIYSTDAEGNKIVELNAIYTANLYRIKLQVDIAGCEITSLGGFTSTTLDTSLYTIKPVTLSDTSVVYNTNWADYNLKIKDNFIYLLNGQLIKSYNKDANDGVELPKFTKNYYELQYYSVGSESYGYRTYIMTDNLKTTDIQTKGNPIDWRNAYCANNEPLANDLVMTAVMYREQVTITGFNKLFNQGDTTSGAVIIAETEMLEEDTEHKYYHLIIRRTPSAMTTSYYTYSADTKLQLLNIIQSLANGETVSGGVNTNVITAYIGNKITIEAVDQSVFTTVYISDFIGIRFSELGVKAKDKSIQFTTNDHSADLMLTTLTDADGNTIDLVDQDEIEITTTFDYINYSAGFNVLGQTGNDYNALYGAIALQKGSSQFAITTSDVHTFKFTIKDVDNFVLKLATGCELVGWQVGAIDMSGYNLSIYFNAEFLVKCLYNDGNKFSVDETQILPNINAICKYTELNVKVIIRNQFDNSILDEYVLTSEDKEDTEYVKYIKIDEDTIFNILNEETEVSTMSIGTYTIKLLDNSSANCIEIGGKTYYLNEMYLAHNSMTSDNQFVKMFTHNSTINPFEINITSELLRKVVNYTENEALAEENRVLNFNLLVAQQIDIIFNSDDIINDVNKGSGNININNIASFVYNYSNSPAITISKYSSYLGQKVLINFDPYDNKYDNKYYSAVKLTIKSGEDVSEVITIQAETGYELTINNNADYTISVEFVGIYYTFSAKLIYNGEENAITETIRTGDGKVIFGNATFVPTDVAISQFSEGSQINFSYTSDVTQGYSITTTLSSGSREEISPTNYLFTFAGANMELTIEISASTANVIIVPNLEHNPAVAEIVGVVNDDLDNAQKVLTRDVESNNQFTLNSGDIVDLYVKTYAGYKFEENYRDYNYASNKQEYEFESVEVVTEGEYLGYTKYRFTSGFDLSKSGRYTMMFAEVEVRTEIKYYSGYYNAENFEDAKYISGADYLTVNSSNFKDDPHIKFTETNEHTGYRFETYTYKSYLGNVDAVKVDADENNKIDINAEMLSYIGEQEIITEQKTQGDKIINKYYVVFTIYANYVRQYKYNISVVSGDIVSNPTIVDKVEFTMVDSGGNTLEKNTYYDSHTTKLILTATTDDTEHYKLSLKVGGTIQAVTSITLTNKDNCSSFSWEQILTQNNNIQIIIQSETYNPTINIKYSTNGSDYIEDSSKTLLELQTYIHNNVSYKVGVNDNYSYTENYLTYNNDGVRLSVIVKKPNNPDDEFYGLSKIELNGEEIDTFTTNEISIEGEDYYEYTFNYTIIGDDEGKGITLYYVKYYYVNVGFTQSST